MQTNLIYFVKVTNTTNRFAKDFGCHIGSYVFIEHCAYGKSFGYTEDISCAKMFKSKSGALEAIKKYEAEGTYYEIVEFKKI